MRKGCGQGDRLDGRPRLPMSLSGEVERVEIGVLPNDGKVIEDRRTYR